MSLAAVSLDDKYALESGRVFITGTQALVRLPMMQRHRDLAAGKNTACYVTGYRGSPLGGVDLAMWQAKKFLKNNHIHFQPGVNEDLAATAVWGTQQLDLFGDSNYDGVFSLWYAKGPGRRPQRRCAAPRQSRGHGEIRRRAAAGRRRPYLQILDHGPSERIRLHGRRDSRC